MAANSAVAAALLNRPIPRTRPPGLGNDQSAVAAALQAREAPPEAFTWGSGGKKMTAEQLARDRAITEALYAQSVGETPTGFWDGLGQFTGAVVGKIREGREDAAEADGRSAYEQAFGALGDNPTREQLMQTAPNGFESPAQRMIWETQMQKAMQGPAYKTFESGGDVLRYDENDPNSTPSVFYDGPDKPVEAYRNLTDPTERAAFGIPETDRGIYQVDQNNQLRTVGGGGVNVNVGGGEGQYDKTLGEINAKKFEGYQTAAETGVRSLTTLQAMETAMADPGFYSGAFGDPVAMLKKVGANLGIDPAGISSIETFNSLSKQSALNVMGGSLGSGFSNADRDFVMDQVANIGNTEEGNRAIIGLQRKLAERQIQIGQLAQQYAEAHDGRLDYKFTQALAQWAEENPVFPDATGAGGGAPSLPDPFSIRGGM